MIDMSEVFHDVKYYEQVKYISGCVIRQEAVLEHHFVICNKRQAVIFRARLSRKTMIISLEYY